MNRYINAVMHTFRYKQNTKHWKNMEKNIEKTQSVSTTDTLIGLKEIIRSKQAHEVIPTIDISIFSLTCVMRRLTCRVMASIAVCLVILIGSLITQDVVYAASSGDPLLETVKPQIQAMFGSGSTVAYCIYIAEIVLGAIAYIKTKNLLMLLGVPILVGFTGAMFRYIGA